MFYDLFICETETLKQFGSEVERNNAAVRLTKHGYTILRGVSYSDEPREIVRAKFLTR